MALPDREQLRGAVARYVEVPGARLFRALGVSPNAVTLLGFLVCVASAYLVGAGWLVAGGIVFLAGGVLDLFDGALARLTGQATPFGALLDSVFDRSGRGGPVRRFGRLYALRADIGENYGDDYRAYLHHRAAAGPHIFPEASATSGRGARAWGCSPAPD